MADPVLISGPQMLMLISFLLLCGYGGGRAANRLTQWKLARAEGQRDTLYRELKRTRAELREAQGKLFAERQRGNGRA